MTKRFTFPASDRLGDGPTEPAKRSGPPDGQSLFLGPPARVRQAKTLTDKQIGLCLMHIRRTSSCPESDTLKLLLSTKGGLRVAEIALISIDAFLDADGKVKRTFEVNSKIAKGGRTRSIPTHPDIRAAITALMKKYPSAKGVAFKVHNGEISYQSPNALAQWFVRFFKKVGLEGCSSHSGRRTFITNLARNANKCGSSLRDVQKLAGHSRLDTTERYIDYSADLTRLVNSL